MLCLYDWVKFEKLCHAVSCGIGWERDGSICYQNSVCRGSFYCPGLSSGAGKTGSEKRLSRIIERVQSNKSVDECNVDRREKIAGADIKILAREEHGEGRWWGRDA